MFTKDSQRPNFLQARFVYGSMEENIKSDILWRIVYGSMEENIKSDILWRMSVFNKLLM